MMQDGGKSSLCMCPSSYYWLLIMLLNRKIGYNLSFMLTYRVELGFNWNDAICHFNHKKNKNYVRSHISMKHVIPSIFLFYPSLLFLFLPTCTNIGASGWWWVCDRVGALYLEHKNLAAQPDRGGRNFGLGHNINLMRWDLGKLWWCGTTQEFDEAATPSVHHCERGEV